MSRELAQLTEETGRDAPAPEAANLDRETMERLAALGYVGTPGPSSVPAGSESGLADPKDKLEVFSAVQQAGTLIADGSHAEAARLLEAAVRREPEMPQALLMLGSCYTELGRRKEAQGAVRPGAQEEPAERPGADRHGEHPARGRPERATS